MNRRPGCTQVGHFEEGRGEIRERIGRKEGKTQGKKLPERWSSSAHPWEGTRTAAGKRGKLVGELARFGTSSPTTDATREKEHSKNLGRNEKNPTTQRKTYGEPIGSAEAVGRRKGEQICPGSKRGGKVRRKLLGNRSRYKVNRAENH